MQLERVMTRSSKTSRKRRKTSGPRGVERCLGEGVQITDLVGPSYPARRSLSLGTNSDTVAVSLSLSLSHSDVERGVSQGSRRSESPTALLRAELEPH